MKVFGRVALAAVAGLLPACSSWQADYLAQQVHRASQEEVAARLGRPTEVKQLQGGGTEWLYHVFSDSMFNYAYRGHPAEQDCREYILTFDERGVLTYWLQQDCG